MMANTVGITAVPNTADDGSPLPPVEVKVSVESPGERDLSAKMDGVDLIQQVATALHLSVSISDLKGDADNAA